MHSLNSIKKITNSMPTLLVHEKINTFNHINKKFVATIFYTFTSPTDLPGHLNGYEKLFVPNDAH